MINKKIKILLIVLIATTCLYGCRNSKIEKNNIDFSTTKIELIDESISKIEIINILNDIHLYNEFKKNSFNYLVKIVENKDDKINEKSISIIYELMESVYRLAINRITSDIDTIYINSSEYKSYIAMLQVFADTFLEEKDIIYKHILEENKNIEELKSMKMLICIDEFYTEILKKINE